MESPSLFLDARAKAHVLKTEPPYTQERGAGGVGMGSAESKSIGSRTGFYVPDHGGTSVL